MVGPFHCATEDMGEITAILFYGNKSEPMLVKPSFKLFFASFALSDNLFLLRAVKGQN